MFGPPLGLVAVPQLLPMFWSINRAPVPKGEKAKANAAEAKHGVQTFSALLTWPAASRPQ